MHSDDGLFASQFDRAGEFVFLLFSLSSALYFSSVGITASHSFSSSQKTSF